MFRKIHNKKAHKLIRGFKRYRSNSIQYISDLHLEKYTTYFKIPTHSKYLALCGDIGNPFKKNYSDFIKYVSNNFEKVFLISGNHEYWQSGKHNIQQVNDKIRSLTQHTNVCFLNMDHESIDDEYIVLGCSLWSKNDNWLVYPGLDRQIINDNEPLSCREINKYHTKCVDFIKENVNKFNNKKIIIISHHMPSFKLIVPKFQTGVYRRLRSRYATNLDYLFKPPIVGWLCGHSHINIETKINNIYCGINSVGYSQEQLMNKINIQYLKLDDRCEP